MNSMVYQLTSFIEKGLHLVILGMVLFLCGYEINNAISSGVIKVQNVLMLFIYL